MTVNDLIEYSYNYSKNSGNLWQHYRDDPACALVNFTCNSALFKFKQKITGSTENDMT